MSSTYTLHREQFISRPLAEVFRFFEDARNLSLITPAKLGFRILNQEPIQMKPGTRIDYTIRLAGLPVRWQTLILSYERPFRFVDEQAKGPYRFWRHEHLFQEKPGGTLITDNIEYALPFDVGELVHRWFVRPQLEQIFDYRTSVIQTVFKS